MPRPGDGNEFFYDLDVPKDYDPNRRYQLRVQLHGSIMSSATSAPHYDASIGALPGAEQIYLYPYAGADAPWWSNAQIDNLRATLDSVKRIYNIDENRVVLAGVSDGATATYYFAMRAPTPFASFLSLNGFLLVLASRSIHVEGELFPNNLLNKPFLIINGAADPLFPAATIEPYIERLRQGGVKLEYWSQPTAGHDTTFWPQIKDRVEAFVHEHPRDPMPAKIVWESTSELRSNRAYWLVIDQLVSSSGIAFPLDPNELIRIDAQHEPPKLFSHSSPFGHVELSRNGNTVDAITRGVSDLTLLISPDAFDLTLPIKVVTNGHVVFDSHVEPSVSTLLKWAAHDNDRTMLFAAELHIKPIE